VLEALLDRWVGSVGKLDPHVRLGLVVSVPFLRKPVRETLAPELARLLACAAEDDDPWVRVMARAVGGVSATGRLDLDAVLADVPPVRAAPRRARAAAAGHRVRATRVRAHAVARSGRDVCCRPPPRARLPTHLLPCSGPSVTAPPHGTTARSR
jgi:hypothetical protein